jgi:predicted O-methyltransferase YrrM
MNLKFGRRTALLATVGWVCVVAILAFTRVVDVSGAVVLVALAPMLVGLILTNRWHQTNLRRFAQLNETLAHKFDVTTKALEQVSGRLEVAEHVLEDVVSRYALEPDAIDKSVKSAANDTVKRVRQGVQTDLMQTYRQLEALQNLYAIGDLERPIPASRVWAASPDLLLFLVGLVERERPKLIVECGSGLSSLWFGVALRKFGIDGRVVALEHDEQFAEQTRGQLHRHGLSGLVEVRTAELEPFELGDKTFLWYGRKGWDDLADIDVMFVDGPPTETGEHARYPAYPLLGERMSKSGVVVLDDMVRKDEQQVLARWLEEHPELTDERVRLEKHAAMVRRK